MPLVRIDMIAGRHSAEARVAMADAVYDALLTVGALPDDRFQIVTEHAAGGLHYGRTYLDIVRTDGFVTVQITMNTGRTLAQKRDLFAAIADGMVARAGVRREDVFINLIEVPKENWSFGNGVAQYAG